jgi:hypothetical protein
MMIEPELEHTKTLTADTDGVTTVVIDANVAHLRLTSGKGSELRAEVTLTSREESRLAHCAKGEFRADREGETLRLTMSQPAPGQRCGERWSIVVPPRLAIRATTEVGDITAELAGSYGNIDIDSSVGNVTLEIDGRRISVAKRNPTSESIRVQGDGTALVLRTNVGDIDAVVTTS